MITLSAVLIFAIVSGYLRGTEAPLPSDSKLGLKYRWRSFIADILVYGIPVIAIMPLRREFGLSDSWVKTFIVAIAVFLVFGALQALLALTIRKFRNQPPPPPPGFNTFGA